MTAYERIDKLLDQRKMSRRQLAKIVGLPPSTLQSMFTRNKGLPLDIAENIANALDVPVTALMSDGSISVTSGDSLETLTPEEISRQFNKVVAAAQKVADSLPLEGKILCFFDKLNDKGQQRAVEQVEDLAKIPDYQKDKTPPKGE